MELIVQRNSRISIVGDVQEKAEELSSRDNFDSYPEQDVDPIASFKSLIRWDLN